MSQNPPQTEFKASGAVHEILPLLDSLLAKAPQDPERQTELRKRIRSLAHSEQFYHRRVHLLEQVQSRMRDPERTLVCDIVANGQLLHGSDGQLDEKRYFAPANDLPAPTAQASPDTAALRAHIERLKSALETAEAALADIGDADREPGDDVDWCEKRAAQALPEVRQALSHIVSSNDVLTSSFQWRVSLWLVACFGDAISRDKPERNHRFLEEALELVQACGCSRQEAHQLVDYVYGRPVGERHQEVGGVMTTLAALCRAQGLEMMQCGEVELARVWTKVEQIRAKQAAKPKGSPLPM